MEGDNEAYELAISQICTNDEEQIKEDKLKLYAVSFEGSTVVIVPGVSYALPRDFAEGTRYRVEDRRRSDTVNLIESKLADDNVLPRVRPKRLGNDFKIITCHEKIKDSN